MNIKLTKQVLRSARRKMERYAARDNSVSDIDSLNCLCGISTYVLFVCFKEMGYNPVFCMNDNHCFLRMGGYWIDLTLRQFNGKCPKIYFKKKPYRKDDGYGDVLLAMYLLYLKARERLKFVSGLIEKVVVAIRVDEKRQNRT